MSNDVHRVHCDCTIHDSLCPIHTDLLIHHVLYTYHDLFTYMAYLMPWHGMDGDGRRPKRQPYFLIYSRDLPVTYGY
jgi:hypothetical protein